MSIAAIGVVFSFLLPIFGATIGCYRTGTTAYNLMSTITKEKGTLIGVAMIPACQIFYGFILMLLLNQSVAAGSVAIESAAKIGLSAGMVFMFVAIIQGKMCIPVLKAVGSGPEVFGKTFIAIGIIDSFALFTMVFVLLLL